MNLLYLIFIHIYFIHQVLCYRSFHGSRRKLPQKDPKYNAKSREDERFSDSYMYSEDYPTSNNEPYYDGNGDYGSDRKPREQEAISGVADAARHYDVEDLSAFSDDEVSLALSMLTEQELDQLDRLIEDGVDQQDAREMINKREIVKSHPRKRECHGESCIQMEKGEAREVRETHSDGDQIASFRPWFSRNKATKTTTRTTTTRKPTRRTSKKRPTTKPTKKSSTTKRNKPQSFSPDRSNILRYGNNKSARDMVDESVREKISFLTNKIKRRVDQRPAIGLTGKDRKTPLRHSPGMNRKEQSSIRQKRNSDIPETRGTLEDSFPHPNHETASFHDPMEPLVRVKRDPLAI